MLSGLDHAVHGARDLVEAVLGPWGGSAAVIDTYESAIRAATDAQLSFARIVDVQPARSIVVALSELTRDVGAVQVASARWVLDV
jgi:hypothetical protein